MKRFLISAFVLLPFLLSLWAISAFFFGAKSEQNFKNFFITESQRKDSIFNYEILNYTNSIFSAKAKVRLDLNLKNNIAKLIGNSFEFKENQTLTIRIFHGPIFFDKTGVSFGKSIFKILFDEGAFETGISNEPELLGLKQLPTVKFIISFKDQLEYEFPIKTETSNLMVEGVYDLKTHKSFGKVISEELTYQDFNQSIQARKLEIKYQQVSSKTSEKLVFKLSSIIPEIIYKHPSLGEITVLDVDYSGNIVFENDVLNSEHSIFIAIDKNINSHNYPFDKAKVTLNINALNVQDLSLLSTKLIRLDNLQQQSDWVLEEQGEYPEGQDQIWQTQDELNNSYMQLPILLNNLLFINNNISPNKTLYAEQNKDNSTFRFSLKTFFKDKQSILDAAIYPIKLNQSIEQTDSSSTSLSSLIQAQAQVKLDDNLFKYISAQLPLIKTNFKLIYKQNKLLMQ